MLRSPRKEEMACLPPLPRHMYWNLNPLHFSHMGMWILFLQPIQTVLLWSSVGTRLLNPTDAHLYSASRTPHSSAFFSLLLWKVILDYSLWFYLSTKHVSYQQVLSILLSKIVCPSTSLYLICISETTSSLVSLLPCLPLTIQSPQSSHFVHKVKITLIFKNNSQI